VCLLRPAADGWKTAALVWPRTSADGSARPWTPLKSVAPAARVSIRRSRVGASADENNREIVGLNAERWLVHQELTQLPRPRGTWEGSRGPPATLSYSTLLAVQPMGSTSGNLGALWFPR
jgi:hypothetical protein